MVRASLCGEGGRGEGWVRSVCISGDAFAGPALPGYPPGSFPSAEEFVLKYASQPQFDPKGFWFITQRCV